MYTENVQCTPNSALQCIVYIVYYSPPAWARYLVWERVSRSAWAPELRLSKLRSYTLGEGAGPQKWALIVKKGKSSRQKKFFKTFFCPSALSMCIKCTFWRKQIVSFSGLSSSLTKAIFRSPTSRLAPYSTWRQSQRTHELKSEDENPYYLCLCSIHWRCAVYLCGHDCT